jgi:hypothetical protein
VRRKVDNVDVVDFVDEEGREEKSRRFCSSGFFLGAPSSSSAFAELKSAFFL